MKTELSAYLKTPFIQKSETNSFTFFGVITDGNYKLDVELNKEEEETIDFEKGDKLEIIGDLRESGKI